MAITDTAGTGTTITVMRDITNRFPWGTLAC